VWVRGRIIIGAAMGISPGTTVGYYEIVGPLGAGGMGEVYRGRDTRLDRGVAIKFLSADLERDPTALERFHREARAASALNHPGICTIHDIGDFTDERGTRPYLVMELMEGQTLRDRIGGRPMALDSLSIKDCTPKLTRVTPHSTRASSTGCSSCPGAHSTVISAVGNTANSRLRQVKSRRNNAGDSRVGVPPPR